MENPDVVVELERNKDGRVVKLLYKVHNPGEDNRRSLEACEITCEALRSENRSTYVDVHVGLVPSG